MKKLTYLLMAVCLIFCVSCSKNSGQGSSAAAGSSKDSEKTEVANKWKGSPAFVEYMTLLDGFEAKVKNCKSCDALEDLGDEFDEKVEILEEKYPDFEPEEAEGQQMEKKTMGLMKLIFEQGKKMECGMYGDLDDDDLDDLWADYEDEEF